MLSNKASFRGGKEQLEEMKSKPTTGKEYMPNDDCVVVDPPAHGKKVKKKNSIYIYMW